MFHFSCTSVTCLSVDGIYELNSPYEVGYSLSVYSLEQTDRKTILLIKTINLNNPLTTKIGMKIAEINDSKC